MSLPSPPSLTVDNLPDGPVLRVTGQLLTAFLDQVEDGFAQVRPEQQTLQFDLSGLVAMDTGGAWLIADLKRRLEAQGTIVQIDGAAPEHLALLETVTTFSPTKEPAETLPWGPQAWLAAFGERIVYGVGNAGSFFSFFGRTLVAIGGVIVRPWRLRGASLFSHMQDVGLNAVPIVALMGFMIGVVLAFQGASQLQRFGAEVFVVELISISVLRELGILLTAIIVAGRSGSAFTASVGSMKVQQEIDAMRTLGLDPIEVLVVPRVLALLLMLPVLGFIANICGLFGGALMSWIDLGVSPGMFLTRLHDNTSVNHLIVGMVKTPFFALVIGVVACWQAFKVEGSSTSVGRRTTASVVQGIFLVIALDALFSIFFARMGF